MYKLQVLEEGQFVTYRKNYDMERINNLNKDLKYAFIIDELFPSTWIYGNRRW